MDNPILKGENMSKICPLYSGSTGNSTYIGTKECDILIDVGASCKGISEALKRVDSDINKIKYIAVTHSHSDHIKGLKAVLKRTGAILIGTEKTLAEIRSRGYITEKNECINIDNGPFETDDIKISAFNTSHDAEGSCGYKIFLPDGKIFTICTDTGIITDEIRDTLTGSDLVLIESNHDIEMLKKGPYPPFLKVRIMSDIGHISNSVCACEIARLYKSGTKRFILGHLSLNNNTPILAKSTSESVLMDLGAKNGKDYLLTVAKPQDNGVIII